MGKVPKAAKSLKENEKESKVKKLLNKPGALPGVNKRTGKLNLKEARVPLTQMLKSNLHADKIVNFLKDSKSVSKKNKKTPSSMVKTDDDIKPKVDLKAEQVSVMKTLKRKSATLNVVKPPQPKKKNVSSDVPIKKQLAKKTEKVSKNDKRQKVPEQGASDVDKEVSVKVQKQLPEEAKKGINVDNNQISKGIDAILKLTNLQAGDTKKLFDGEHQPILLQVACIKVPKIPKRQLRILLPHTLVTDTDDVVLFVGDMKKGRRQNLEPTIDHYQDLLRKHGCKQIKDVIPLTQVKTEFDQYELKRKLLSSYDYFLTDGKIAGHLSHHLGKLFMAKRKLPTSIRMNAKNLNREIDIALKKTSMHLHSYGDTHVVQVAHTGMKKQEIFANVLSVCKSLADNYPGGWLNIRSLILKTSTSLPVPIYITLKSKNKVKVPVVVPKRPKAYQTLVGELSTSARDAKVVVYPDGTVKVEKDENRITKKVDKLAAKKSKLPANQETAKISKRNKQETTVTGKVEKKLETTEIHEPFNIKAEDSDDNTKTAINAKSFTDSEDEIEDAEQAYLSQWQQETISTTTEEKEPKKRSKIVKKKKKTKA
ncbi:ribosomal L1 domain-containing protein 1 [Neodiprion fabricii]|uniref:ribosomal L1 domain-containing protein 1 n=1 Tax=Neodiprion fabricii TaxID=2872261 RepID=UPI001ED984EB|nr:ribosomal L1 domain-containing protein 1 [Neodiprion fabricii]